MSSFFPSNWSLIREKFLEMKIPEVKCLILRNRFLLSLIGGFFQIRILHSIVCHTICLQSYARQIFSSILLNVDTFLSVNSVMENMTETA